MADMKDMKDDIAQDKANDDPSAHNSYRDQVVMESGGSIQSDASNYVESDDEMDAIAEGWK